MDISGAHRPGPSIEGLYWPTVQPQEQLRGAQPCHPQEVVRGADEVGRELRLLLASESRHGEWQRHCTDESLRDRFRPHVFVHEMEALLLVSPKLARVLGKEARVPAYPHPERVNHNKPPSRHLADLFSKHRKDYDKVTDGLKLSDGVRADEVARTCPYFRAFLEDLDAVLARTPPRS